MEGHNRKFLQMKSLLIKCRVGRLYSLVLRQVFQLGAGMTQYDSEHLCSSRVIKQRLRKVSCLQGLSCLTGTIQETWFLPILCKCVLAPIFSHTASSRWGGIAHFSNSLPFNLSSVCTFSQFSFSWSFHLSFLYLNSHPTVHNYDHTGLSSFLFSSCIPNPFPFQCCLS